MISIVLPDCCTIPKFTNLKLLEISATLFSLFLIAEIIGAYYSHSLSLLGDSVGTGVDVSTYLINIYVEYLKSQYGRVNARSRYIVDVLVPSVSVLALITVTAYITLDAIRVLSRPPRVEVVDVRYLYSYAVVNLTLDLICSVLFYHQRDSVFEDKNTVPKLSLDTSISALDESDDEEFGYLEDSDTEDFINSNRRKNKSSHAHSNPLQLDKFSSALNIHSDDSDDSAPGFNESGYGKAYDKNVVNNPPETTNTIYSFCTFLLNIILCRPNERSHGESSKKNLNMLSAFAHILGDTLRTVTMFLAASIASIFSIDADVCDAWAAIIAAISILGICGPLLVEISKAAKELRQEQATSLGPNQSNIFITSNTTGNNSNSNSHMTQTSSNNTRNVVYVSLKQGEDEDELDDGELEVIPKGLRETKSIEMQTFQTVHT